MNVDGGPGMTLRDYFMAHAPAEPQPWFEPVMPPRPETLNYSDIADEATRDDVGMALNCDTDPKTKAGVDWLRRYDEQWAALNDWDRERVKQRLVQWPYAWADAQIAERSKS